MIYTDRGPRISGALGDDSLNRLWRFSGYYEESGSTLGSHQYPAKSLLFE
jgi:hypothetical protein